MSKYDCTKCLDYAHELERMCSTTMCSHCILQVPSCQSPNTKEKIDFIQKWSDENPEPHEKTILEDFKEKFPNVKTEIGEGLERFPVDIHPCDLYGDIFECSHECYQCWNRPLSEVSK